MSAPVVSVIMPAHNAGRFIVDAIESVRAQTLTDWELIVVDDCSTDATPSIAWADAERDARIRVLSNERGIGAAASRNRALRHARGVYMAFLDSDDLWEPTKLERQVRCAREQGAGIVYCSYALIDESGRRAFSDYLVPESTTYEEMLEESVIGCSTALVSGELARRFQFPTNVYHEDYAYWLRLLRGGARAVGLREVLASYRVRRGSRASNKALSAVRRYRVYRDCLGLSRPICAHLMVRYLLNGIRKYAPLREGGIPTDREGVR